MILFCGIRLEIDQSLGHGGQFIDGHLLIDIQQNVDVFLLNPGYGIPLHVAAIQGNIPICDNRGILRPRQCGRGLHRKTYRFRDAV